MNASRLGRTCFIGNSSYSLLNHFLGFLFKSYCLFFVSSFLVISIFPPNLLPAHQDFRILNYFRSCSLYNHLSSGQPDQNGNFILFSWLSMLLSTGLLLRYMFPNLAVPNPSMFYNYWNFCFLCWIFHEVYMHLMYWSFNLMLQNDAFSSLCG